MPHELCEGAAKEAAKLGREALGDAAPVSITPRFDAFVPLI